ncbi:MAG: hypothetical protein ACTHON_13550 [Humibacter sp.]
MLLPEDRIAVGINEAVRLIGVSPRIVRRAIRTSDPTSYPPPLRAKWMGRKYSIRVADLIEWWESLEDA